MKLQVLKETNFFATRQYNQTIGDNKQLRKVDFGENGSEEKRKEFYQCIKAISELKKREKRKQNEKMTAHHEKEFHKIGTGIVRT